MTQFLEYAKFSMLFRSSHNQIASNKFDPERERRLLWNNGGVNTGGSSDPDPDTGPDSGPDNGSEQGPDNDPHTGARIEGERERTRDDTTGVMTGDPSGEDGEAQAEDIDPAQLAVDINELGEQAREFQNELKNIKALIKKQIPADDQQEYLEGVDTYEQNMEDMLESAGLMYSIARMMSMKQNNRDYDRADYLVDIHSILGRVGMPKLRLPPNVMDLDDDDFDNLINEQMDMNDLLKTVNSDYNEMKKSFENARALQSELLGNDRTSAENTDGGGIRAAFNRLGIGFFTIAQVGKGLSKYWEAMKKSHDQWDERKGSAIAQAIGKMAYYVPLTEGMHAVLDADVEAKHNEELKEHKDLLESKNFQFDESLKELQRQQGQPNKMRAVIEHMAENGWLYDFDRSTQMVFGIHIELPGSWNDETKRSYMIQLDLKYSEGQEKMKKRGKDLVGTAENIPPIVRELESELALKNYWSAHGLLEVAYNKGKDGQTGAWIATTIMRHIRDDPHARKYFPKDLLDQLGNLGIVHPAWTTTLLKMDRNDIEKWQKTDDPRRFEEAGNLAGIITEIEKDMSRRVSASFMGDRAKVNSAVGRILAAQVVDIDGQKFSIYQNIPAYNTYRKTLRRIPTTIEVGKADDDFYQNVSDSHLIGDDGFSQILKADTSGEFNFHTKATSYIETLFKLHDDLAALPDAQANFETEMQAKFGRFLKQQVRGHGVTFEKWKAKTRREGAVRRDPNTLKDATLLQELVNAKMIDPLLLDEFLGLPAGTTRLW